MGASSTQLLIVAVVSLSFAMVVIRLAKKQLISLRYTIGWLFLLGISILAGLLIPLVDPIASFLNLSAVAVLVGISVLILLAVCIQLSISISGLQREVQVLADEIVLLRSNQELK